MWPMLELSCRAMVEGVMWMKFIALTFTMVFFVPGVLFVDFVDRVLRSGPQEVQPPHISYLHAWSQAFSIWSVVLWWQMRFWHWLLVGPPMTISTVLLQLILATRSFLGRRLLTEVQRRSLIANRIAVQLQRYVAEANSMEEDDGRGFLYKREALSCSVDLCVLLVEWERIAACTPYVSGYGRQLLPLGFLGWHCVTYGRRFWQIRCTPGELLVPRSQSPPWQLSPMPLHTEPVDADCPIHDTCRICLENLCEAQLESVSRGRLSSCSLSSCRSRPRSASPGISAGRRQMLQQLNRNPSTCSSRNIATLRCMHSFHEDCIAAWRRKRPFRTSCPTCRMTMVERPEADAGPDPIIEVREICLCLLGSFTMLLLLYRAHQQAHFRHLRLLKSSGVARPLRTSGA